MQQLVLAMVLLLVSEGLGWAQSQPARVLLNSNGVSKIFPPFDTEGWIYTRGSGDATHQGDDFYAQDWARDCFSQGQRLYTGISGTLQINRDRDGSMDYYGNTLLVVDYQRGFAQRFAHLQDFAPGLRSGDMVLAGEYIGKVGATGNVTASSSCAQQGGNGAHAHIVLYKNVPSSSGRPLTSITTIGSATQYAARFTYVSQEELVKADNNATVYVNQNGQRVPITAAVFANQGWNFDRSRVLFDPLAGNIKPSWQIDSMPLANWFWSLRNSMLIRSSSDQTVFLVQDGLRKGLTSNVFNCRGFNFGDVKVLPNGDVPRYPAFKATQIAVGCTDEYRQALADLTKTVNLDGRMGPLQLGSYGFDNNWDVNWELRWAKVSFGGQITTLNHATSRSDPSLRYVIYWDPFANQWRGWYRMY